MPEREVVTYCRICAAACGLVVTVDGDDVVRIRGDREHPVSRGYVCPKGRALAEHHRAPRRLDHPRAHGHATDWDTALDDLAARLAALVAESGPDAVAVYLATGVAYDVNGWMAGEGLIRALGTRQRYTPVTVDNAAALVAAELVAGHATLNPVWDPQRCDLLLLVGTNPVVSHGYGTALPDPVRRLREFRSAGGTVVVVDPRRTETAAHADHHLAIRPGTDHLLLAWLVRAALDALDDRRASDVGDLDPADLAAIRTILGPLDAHAAAVALGISTAELHDLTTAVLAADGIAVHCGTGVTMAEHGLLAEWLRWLLLALTRSLDAERGMQFNRSGVVPVGGPAAPPGGRVSRGPQSRPELVRVLGQHPCVALADEIEQGTVRALVVIGGRPDLAFPDRARIDAALSSLDTLVVVDTLDNDLARRATHAFPACGQLERADVPMQGGVQFADGLQATRAVVEAAAQRRPVWWIAAQLARRLGGDALGGLDPDATSDTDLLARLVGGHDALDALDARGRWEQRRPGWVHATLLPDGRWRFGAVELLERLRTAVRGTPAAGTGMTSSGMAGDGMTGDGMTGPGRPAGDHGGALLLVVGRRVGAVNATAWEPTALDDVSVHLAPSDVAALGLTAGTRVRVTSEHGAVTGTVQVDERLRAGTVWCGHGSAALAVNQLTTGDDGVIDPRTGMAPTTAVAVQVQAL